MVPDYYAYITPSYILSWKLAMVDIPEVDIEIYWRQIGVNERPPAVTSLPV